MNKEPRQYKLYRHVARPEHLFKLQHSSWGKTKSVPNLVQEYDSLNQNWLFQQDFPHPSFKRLSNKTLNTEPCKRKFKKNPYKRVFRKYECKLDDKHTKTRMNSLASMKFSHSTSNLLYLPSERYVRTMKSNFNYVVCSC